MTAVADQPTEQLTFEGFDVVGHSFTISGDVDGAGEPMEYRQTRWLAVQVQCAKVHHDPASKDNVNPVRVHKLVVVAARPLDDVLDSLAAHYAAAGGNGQPVAPSTELAQLDRP